MNSKPIIEVCLSPTLLHLYDTKDTIVVIIDIFRATSTMVTALSFGAKKVIPISSVQECIDLGKVTPDSITAGERDGKVADGLTHGNSPMEYASDFIKDKTLLLTTTNGTKLLHMVEEASEKLIGSFLNLSALCDYLKGRNQKVLMACAAWKDRVNMEDSLFAGAVVDRLKDDFNVYCDSGRMTSTMYREAMQSSTLIDYLKSSTHYKRLAAMDLEDDLAYCAQIDKHPVVPKYNGFELIPATL